MERKHFNSPTANMAELIFDMQDECKANAVS